MKFRTQFKEKKLQSEEGCIWVQVFDQDLSKLFFSHPVHNIEVWQVTQEASPPGWLEQDAKRRSITDVQTKYPYPSASHGTLVCPCNAIRFQAGALAKTLARSYSGVSHLSHTKHYDTSVLWERAGHGKGMLITSNQKALFQLLFIVFEYPKCSWQIF